jgi:hypothetical protein
VVTIVRTSLASLLACGALAFAPARALAAADVLAVGAGKARAGATVTLPVTFADLDETPLNEWMAPGTRARSFSFHVSAEPASAVASVAIARSGIALQREPLLEEAFSSGPGGALALVLATDGGYWYSQPDPVELARVTVVLSATAVPGTTVALKLQPATTLVANQYGTVVETVGAGTLALGAGSIAVLPTVSVGVADALAAEPGVDTARLLVTRTGSTAAALKVWLKVAGTASPTDYFPFSVNKPLGSYVVIPKGARSLAITVRPRDDASREATETVRVVLVRGTGYALDLPNTATVSIRDND